MGISMYLTAVFFLLVAGLIVLVTSSKSYKRDIFHQGRNSQISRHTESSDILNTFPELENSLSKQSTFNRKPSLLSVVKRSAANENPSSRRRRRRRKKKRQLLSPLESKSDNKESFSDNEGLLRAKEIQSKQLQTDILRAKSVKADRIHSDIVISDVIVVSSIGQNSRLNKPIKMSSFEGARSKATNRDGSAQHKFRSEREQSRSQGQKRTPRKSTERRRSRQRNTTPTYRVFDLSGGKVIPHEPISGKTQYPVGRKNSYIRTKSLYDHSLSENNSPGIRRIDSLQSIVKPKSRSSRRIVRRRKLKSDYINEPPLKSAKLNTEIRLSKNENQFQESKRPKKKLPRSRYFFMQASERTPVRKEDQRGLLRAEDISAVSIDTESMIANRISADKIKSKNVDAGVLNVKYADPATMSFFEVPSPKQSLNPNENIDSRKSRLVADNPFIRPKIKTSGGVFPSYTLKASKSTGTNAFLQRKYNNRTQSKSKEYTVMTGKQDMLVKSQELAPSLELLGISNTYQPNLQMFVEPPVVSQRMKYYSNSRPFANLSGRKMILKDIQISQTIPQSEYIHDNYNSFTKSLNLYGDLFLHQN